MGWLHRTARELHDDQEGASMVFATITFFTLGVVIMFVFQVGMVSTDRIQIQNAADAAAYSGALVEANSLNSIGQVNDAMAHLHYILLRYTVDNIVYETLNEFNEHHRRPMVLARVAELARLSSPFNQRILSPPDVSPPPADPRVAIGDAGEWTTRYRAVRTNHSWVQQGIEWLGDLHRVGRMIMAVTPRLVRDRIGDVAYRNGATHVGISRDLELAFQLDRREGGFYELGAQGLGGNDTQAALQSVWRYSLRELGVDGKPRGFPSWFDPQRGTNSQPYSQVRLCWAANDWGHDTRPTGHLLGDLVGGNPQPFSGAGPPPGGAPNGHWHHQHFHTLINPNTGVQVMIPHGGMAAGQELPTLGSGTGGGHQADDTILHGSPPPPLVLHPLDIAWVVGDHAVIRCPTCWGNTSSQAFGEVEVNSDRSDLTANGKTHAPPPVPQRRFQLDLNGVLGYMPRPLGINGRLLQSGVTVTTWRAGLGIGDLFPASPWGTVAVATAQVGLIDGSDPEGGRVLLMSKLSKGGGMGGGMGGGRGGGTATYGSATVDAGTGATSKPRELNLREQFGGESPGGGVAQPPRFPAGQSNYRNLFYDPDFAHGVRFGARLVPVASANSWHPSLKDGAGLAELIGADGRRKDDRWFETREGGVKPIAAGAGSAPPGIGSLSDYLSVDSAKALEEALWH